MDIERYDIIIIPSQITTITSTPQGKPIDCDYYLMITKIYHEVEAMVEEGDDKEEEMQESNHKRKKAKKSVSVT